MKLIFATHNQHKVEELKKIVPQGIQLLSLEDINCREEIEETGATLEENAKIKADFVKYKYGLDCFADDSGLEIEALGGAPGVFSARYAGDSKNNADNIQKIWRELEGLPHPVAQFRTVIASSIGASDSLFEGLVKGHLIFEKRGSVGFGYDPIFIPAGFTQTFAELGDAIKNKISHRALATQAFLKALAHLKS